MPFPVIVHKGCRTKMTHKFLGGVYNPVKRCYVYTTESNRNPMERLKKVAIAIDMRDITGQPVRA